MRPWVPLPDPGAPNNKTVLYFIACLRPTDFPLVQFLPPLQRRTLGAGDPLNRFGGFPLFPMPLPRSSVLVLDRHFLDFGEWDRYVRRCRAPTTLQREIVRVQLADVIAHVSAQRLL